MKTPTIISVIALEKYLIKIRFNDDTEGIIDLADSAGKGVFKSWDIDNNFDKVYLSKETGAISWPGRNGYRYTELLLANKRDQLRTI